MPKYWFTTHYPKPADQSVDWNIYMQRDRRSPEREPAPGDKVIFFELATARQIAGATRIAPGERKVVAVGTVLAPFTERKKETATIKYTNGTTADWAYEAVCGEFDHVGRVDQASVNRILKLSPKSTLFGFADGSGLMEMSEAQYNEMLEIFKSNPRE